MNDENKTAEVPKENTVAPPTTASSILKSSEEEKLLRHLPPEIQDNKTKCVQFMRTLGAHIQGNGRLMGMFQSGLDGRVTILKAATEAANFGLMLGHHAYLIPYKNSVKMVADYKGILDLWRRDPEHQVWAPELVFEADEFEMNKGIVNGTVQNTLFHRRPLVADDQRGNLIGGYIRWSHRGQPDYLFIHVSEFHKERERAERIAKNNNEPPPWVSHFNQMCLKTLVRRAARYGNTSPQVTRASYKMEYEVEDVTERHGTADHSLGEEEKVVVTFDKPEEKVVEQTQEPAKSVAVDDIVGDNL